MKDYSYDEETKRNYILSTKIKNVNGNETIEVKFADGTIFSNIKIDSLDSVEQQQEEQVEKAIEEMPHFKLQKTRAGVITGMSVIASMIFGVTLATKLGFTGTKLIIATGIVTLLFTTPELINFAKCNFRLKELEKLNYRNEHKDELCDLEKYPNALSGLPNRIRTMVEKENAEDRNPFSVLNVNYYNKKNLEMIVENIEREKKYNFQYQK